MKKNLKSGIIVLVCMLVFIIGAITVLSITDAKNGINNFEDYFTYKKLTSISGSGKSDYKPKIKKPYIGALYIEGTIEQSNNTYNQSFILNTIEELKNDDNNKALAIYINSPGGAVYQADAVYFALQDYKTTGKKIYVYQGPMAASGGYYISCAANKIYANRNTLTGSIGVICGNSIDLTGLFEKLGIKYETVHSGKNKNMMNYNEPFTDEQRDIMQSICDECYEQFVSIVVSQRKIPYPKIYEIADGRVYTANQALKLDLIDEIDSWENMLDDLAEEIDRPDIDVKTFKYQKKQSMVEMMMGQYSDVKKTEAAASLGLPACVLSDIENNSITPLYLYK